MQFRYQTKVTLYLAPAAPVYVQWSLSNTDTLWTKITLLIGEVPLLQGENIMYSYKAGTQTSVLINQGPLFQGCPLREVPVYIKIYN